ncbi:MAG: 2-hydroxyacyl-CoA dehydratase [Clostridia bacterium]|nr:2-hydroxyacyl-CoA dehydratase [Clostridia bacterium]
MKERSAERKYIPFTKEMRSDYTILVPNMLPRHFKLFLRIFEPYGYHMELLETSGKEIIEKGLKYVHNDTCYPAILVIGQFLDALTSGKYDPHKTALVLFQTGGGCRASNYIFLLRKALERAGYAYVPVISLSLAGLEKHPGFTLTVPILRRLFFAIMYGDLLLSLTNQCKPYEIHPGETEKLADELTASLAEEMRNEGVSFRKVKENARMILSRFAAIERKKEEKVQVGVVGEIYVKYSPFGNNNLEQFLIDEGAEVTVPGLLDFFLYCIVSNMTDYELYGLHPFRYPVVKFAFRYLVKQQNELIDLIKEHGVFKAPTPITHTMELIKDFMGLGTKMGEGWLLPAEMLELNDSGVHNIVCTQPFGCLPNHICGKGMMKPLKEQHPNMNIIAIDYDAGASKVNQENRIKLMLANARADLDEMNRENEISIDRPSKKVTV